MAESPLGCFRRTTDSPVSVDRIEIGQGIALSGARRMTSHTLSVLYAIRSGHSYIASICQITGMSDGTAYSILGRLERRGLLSSVIEVVPRAISVNGRRRHYLLTVQGLQALGELGGSTDRSSPVATDPGS